MEVALILRGHKSSNNHLTPAYHVSLSALPKATPAPNGGCDDRLHRVAHRSGPWWLSFLELRVLSHHATVRRCTVANVNKSDTLNTTPLKATQSANKQKFL